MRFLFALLLALLPSMASAQTVPLCRGGSGYVPCASIHATKIGTGSVDDTEFGFLDGVAAQISTISAAQILTNKTINCANNTCTVRLTADVSGVLPIANGGTNSSTALNNSRPIVSSGGALIETASTCPAGTMLAGGSPPDCTQSGSLATQLTTPKVTSSAQLALNAATGNSVALKVNDTDILTASATGLTAAQPLAMNSKKITGLATATASGDALGYPWITSTYGSSILGATYTLSAANGTFSDTGLSVSLPSAGTYKVTADVRAEVLVSLGAGAFIVCKFYNATDAADVANSERLITQANSILVLSQNTASINRIITVAAAKTISLYCSRNAGTTYTTSDIPSDGNGRTAMFYEQISDN